MEPCTTTTHTLARAALLALLAFLAPAAGCEDEEIEQPPVVGEPGEQRDLVYAGAPGGVELLGDLILPLAVEPPPVVVIVHGGGFFQGSRGSMEEVAQALAARGLASFNVDYRLVGVSGGEFPASSVDVRDTIRFLRAQRSELAVGPVCGTLGSSAGGTLAALAAFTEDDPTMVRGGWPDLHGYSDVAPVFVGLYGVYDFTTRFEQHGYVPWPEEDYLGGTFEEQPAKYEYASPATWVDGDEGPVLLLHGEQDALVDLIQAEELRDDLLAAGVDATLHSYPDSIHSFLFPQDDDNPDGLDAMERSVEFLVERCADAEETRPGRGTREVVQLGTATLDGSALTGEESYLLQEADSNDVICSRSYRTTGVAEDEDRVTLTYELVQEDGVCADAPYSTDDGETRIYVLDLDSRDGGQAMFLDDQGRGLFRWFDLQGAAGTLEYGLTQRLVPDSTP